MCRSSPYKTCLYFAQVGKAGQSGMLFHNAFLLQCHGSLFQLSRNGTYLPQQWQKQSGADLVSAAS